MKRINLIPPEYRGTSKVTKKRIHKSLVVLLSICVFMYLWQATAIIRYKFSISANKKHFKKIQSQLTKDSHLYEQIKEQREKAMEQRKRISRRIQLLQETKKEGLQWSILLVHMSDLVPQEIWLKEVTLKGKEIKVKGASPNNTVVSNFMAKMDESIFFGTTGFNFIQKNLNNYPGIMDFEITSSLNTRKIKEKR